MLLKSEEITKSKVINSIISHIDKNNAFSFIVLYVFMYKIYVNAPVKNPERPLNALLERMFVGVKQLLTKSHVVIVAIRSHIVYRINPLHNRMI